MNINKHLELYKEESLTLWNILFHKNNYFLSSWAYKYCKMCLLNGNRSEVEKYLSGAHQASFMIDLEHGKILRKMYCKELLGSDV